MRLKVALEVHCLSCNVMYASLNQQFKVLKIVLALYVGVVNVKY